MSAERSSSPTPSERERLDREAKTKEAAEQAALPYKWTQTIQDADITIPVAANIRARDLNVVLTKTAIKVQMKGGETFIDVSWDTIKENECYNDSFPNFSYS
jgi:hypothetical protein